MSSSNKSSQRNFRCAIYTRKSSEEGLDQDFNSLDAQREACEAYIRSQKHEGWLLVENEYNDGGYSGGTMERPALKRLLLDIGQGKVNVVVVYKVDRLTRALADFAKIVEIFDQQNASFVSVTQQFNTTTSMGRLTLNVLLSFAQFEREVTGERIRDKIAASKKRGMWMGGNIPLGYDVVDRKLLINELEAETVRMIFRKYLQIGSIRELKQTLDQMGVVSKAHVNITGRRRGGVSIARGALYLILQNRIYLGEIVHKENSYPGEHPALIDQELWDAVQARLESNRVEIKTGQRAATPSLLAGFLFDANGRRMTPSHSAKGRTRFRYYVTQPLNQEARASVRDGQRISASEIETKVTERFLDWLQDSAGMLPVIQMYMGSAAEQQRVLDQIKNFLAQWPTLSPAQMRGVLIQVLKRVIVADSQIQMEVRPDRLLSVLEGKPGTMLTNTESSEEALVTLSINVRLQRCGYGVRMIVEAERARKADPKLVGLIVKAHAWKEKLLSGQYSSMEAIAHEENVTSSWMTRVLRLAFLSPEITRSILDGRQPLPLTAVSLIRDTRLAISWAEQNIQFGFNKG